MGEQNKEQLSPIEAARKLVERDENGNYKMDLFEDQRKSLTDVVSILNQVDLKEQDPKQWQTLKKALGMIGAHDKYGFPGNEKNIKASQLPELSKNGEIGIAILYVRNFLNARTAVDLAFIEDRFNKGRMEDWIEASQNIMGKETKTVGLKEALGVVDGQVTPEQRSDGREAIGDLGKEEKIVEPSKDAPTEVYE